MTGKVGTDIEDTKCSWLLVQALHRVNEEQMKVLKVCYMENFQHDISCVIATNKRGIMFNTRNKSDISKHLCISLFIIKKTVLSYNMK